MKYSASAMRALWRATVVSLTVTACREHFRSSTELISQYPDQSILREIDSLTWGRVLAAEDARASTQEQLEALLVALHDNDPAIRRLAVRAIGRLEREDMVDELAALLSDSDSLVRIEAANALGQAVSGSRPGAVFPLLQARFGEETAPEVRGVIAQTLGRLGYGRPADIRAVETTLLDAMADAPPEMLLGIARGLESLFRLNRASVSPSARSVERLYVLSRFRSADDPLIAVRVRRLSLAALAGGAFVDTTLLRAALRDPDVEVRRLAAGAVRALVTADQWKPIVEAALQDVVASVRYAALQSYGRRMSRTDGCEPIIAAVRDGDPHVYLLAIELLGANCSHHAEAVELLVTLVGEPAGPDSWHRPTRALVALASAAPGRAAAALPMFAEHDSWWVRMYAARAATVLRDTSALERFASDSSDNVREVGISGLWRTVGHEADSIYVRQLSRPDYQLVITAAGLLAGSPTGRGAIPAVLTSLERITAQRRETSRDARRALLSRLEEFGGPQQADYLASYLRDFDTVIAADAARIIRRWTGRTWAAQPESLPRQPLPSYGELVGLTEVRAVIEMRGGASFELALLPGEAPTNTARFARLAREGYFNGLTFHRVVPGFVIQGGSPNANEYMGDGPYTRDELVKESHLRGTVGISTRGRDTGDGQIFINLVDNPRLDHAYTIIAEVVRGIDVVDRILEGAVIERITFR